MPRRPFPWRGWLAAFIVLGLLIWSAQGTGASLKAFLDGVPQMLAYFRKLLPSAAKPWPMSYWAEIKDRLLETVRISLAASVVGSALALPMVLIATRQIAADPIIYALGRGFLNLIRTVPDLVLANLLVAGFGLGPLPGLLALIIFTFGIVAKLLCDKVETVDIGPLEAIAATGGTRVEGAIFALLPQIAPDYVAYTLYAFEINIRVAAILGFVGAGGIGQILYRDINFFRYGHVGMVIAATFVVVFLIDSASIWLRSKLV